MNGKLHICLHRGTSIVSRLIEWQTRGAYSHASLLLPDGRQIEAWADGVNIRTTFQAHDSAVDFFTVDASDAQVAQIVAFANGEIGCPYDWLGDACFVTRMHPPSASAEAWFCSELVYAAIQSGGIDLFRATQPFEVSPALLGRSPLLRPVDSPINQP